MVNSKNYAFKQRILTKETIESIKQTIKDNAYIDIKKLIAVLHVNPPFINKDKAMQYIEDLKKTEDIDINRKGEVSLCQC